MRMSTSRRLVLAAAAALLAAGPALACVEFPRVVDSSVVNGATGVDPGLTEITFTFSTPMNRGGWSVVKTTDGQTPEIAGPPRFSPDGRTFVLPVKLKPGQRYDMLLNGGRHHNFRSHQGIKIAPYHFSFTTRD